MSFLPDPAATKDWIELLGPEVFILGIMYYFQWKENKELKQRNQELQDKRLEEKMEMLTRLGKFESVLEKVVDLVRGSK